MVSISTYGLLALEDRVSGVFHIFKISGYENPMASPLSCSYAGYQTFAYIVRHRHRHSPRFLAVYSLVLVLIWLSFIQNADLVKFCVVEWQLPAVFSFTVVSQLLLKHNMTLEYQMSSRQYYSCIPNTTKRHHGIGIYLIPPRRRSTVVYLILIKHKIRVVYQIHVPLTHEDISEIYHE